MSEWVNKSVIYVPVGVERFEASLMIGERKCMISGDKDFVDRSIASMGAEANVISVRKWVPDSNFVYEPTL